MHDWIFVVAGPDEFGHLAEVCEMCRKFDVAGRFYFLGPQFDQDKRDAYAVADLFILPTLSEGAPSVVLEALAAKVPVITTQGAPWKRLVEERCGWWTEISAAGIGAALESAVNCPVPELREMGRRGWNLVRDKFMWPEIGKRSAQLYSWLKDGGEKPEFVFLT
jgi:glycosyltransferase involved in cell wall biosynthesis